MDALVAGAIETTSVGSGGALLLANGSVFGGTTVVAGPIASPETISGATLAAGALFGLYNATVLSGAPSRSAPADSWRA